MLDKNRDKLKSAIVCVAAGKSQVVVIKKAKELGYKVIGIDRDPEAPGFVFCDEQIVESTYDGKAIINELKKIKHKYNVKGVVNRSSGFPVVTAAKICKEFDIPSTSPESARTIIDKSELMKICNEIGIPSPKSQFVTEFCEIDHSKLNYPIVVKPSISLIGKTGVHVIKNKSELKHAIDMAYEVSMNNKVNIEEYLPGYDLSLLALVNNGKVLPIILRDELNIIKKNGTIGFCGIAVPSEFSNKPEELKILDLTQQIVNKFQLDRTVINLSCRCEPGGDPKLVEIHLDLGGDLFFESLVPESATEDILSLIIEFLTGRLNEIPNLTFVPTALMFDRGKELISERPYSILKAKNRNDLNSLISNSMELNLNVD